MTKEEIKEIEKVNVLYCQGKLANAFNKTIKVSYSREIDLARVVHGIVLDFDENSVKININDDYDHSIDFKIITNIEIL